MPSEMIDWVVAEWIASHVAGTGNAPEPQVDLEAIVSDARTRVIAYTGLVPTGPPVPPEAVDRREWVAANIASTRALMDPLLNRMSGQLGPGKPAAQMWLATVSSTEIGVLLGYMGQRVLGQYELVLLREHAGEQPPRLLFVMPNLAQSIRRFKADEQEFITWVALHEVTHAVQFGGVPWLQDYLADLIRELMGSVEERMSARRRLRIPDREAIERFGRAAERVSRAALRADLLGMVASAPEQAMIDQTQAVMAVIEGHAEHVMDAVAPELLPSLPALREALDERRKVQSPLGRLVSRLLGLEMKMKQYERGKIFCDAIDRHAGAKAFERLFSGPEFLPDLAEIDDPSAWLSRVDL
jgi:coenzyme F420 biosynthesis associated uncharacterized protein